MAAVAIPANPPPADGARRSGISGRNLQEHLDSARNAAAKGQAQWPTPTMWGRALACALPGFRPCIADLTCGTGQLIEGIAAPSTREQLGCDIEAVDASGTAFINADLTRLYPLLKAVDWQADLFALTPPWDLHWYRDRLAGLDKSICPAVGAAFAAHDGRTTRDTIDSTVATLCIALDRSSPFGEGLLIANEATLQRQILGPGAPHAALVAHIWAHLVIEGNICEANGQSGTDFRTGVIYFARTHSSGCRLERHIGVGTARPHFPSQGGPDADGGRHAVTQAELITREFQRERLTRRRGASIRNFAGAYTETTAKLWQGCADEWALQAEATARTRPQWNIYLQPDGTIATALSLYDENSGRVNPTEAARLHSLNGRHPMSLVLQRAERKELERAALGGIYRVAPAVQDAVRQAISEYHAERSPLYPLKPIQRLGYLDENDDILCLKDLGHRYLAGRRYKLRTETVSLKRAGEKMNLQGELDAVEWSGSELAIFIAGESGPDAVSDEYLFMDEWLRSRDVVLSIQKEGEPSPIAHTLQQLVDHFEIPEVPDISVTRPAEYERNLSLLAQIEEICNRN